MKFTHTDSKFDYYLGNFEGIEVKIYKDKITGEVYFNIEDVAKCLGHENSTEMIQSNQNITDCYLDAINDGKVITIPIKERNKTKKY